MDCPLCGSLCSQTELNNDLWICPDCPFVGFEFFGNKDIKNLADYLLK